MEPRPLSYIAEACAAELLAGSPNTRVTGASTDSRQLQPGDLFVALAGDRFDGHDFLDAVARQGAAAVVVSRPTPSGWPSPCARLRVSNTREALGRLAARYRRDYPVPIVAVGGSNGKTTTKDLIAAVMATRFRTLASPASFNNNVGVPLTLLQLERTCQAAVLEVGTNHPGELAPLVRMAEPQIGVITQIGREHLEFFGDLAGVRDEEGWLAELLPAHGVLIVNADSPEIEAVVRRTSARVVRVGHRPEHDWRVRAIEGDHAGTRFSVIARQPGYEGPYQLNLIGRHQVANALLALAVGAELGLSAEEIRRGLASSRPARRRLEVRQGQDIWVLDDSYNANADSMLAALQTLRDFPCAGRRVAVLGEMAELGPTSAAAHAEVGRAVAELRIDQLFAVGKMGTVMGTAARAAGLPRVVELAEAEAAAQALRGFVRVGDVVLVKASRVARLERVSDALVPLETRHAPAVGRRPSV